MDDNQRLQTVLIKLSIDMEYMDRGSFKKGNLIKLDQSNLGVVGLKSDLFNGLSSLEVLNLRQNQLSLLDKDIFKGLKYI